MPLNDKNLVVNGPFWVEVANPGHPFTAMLISRSRGTCLIMPRECARFDIVSGLILKGSGGANGFKDHKSPSTDAHD